MACMHIYIVYVQLILFLLQLPSCILGDLDSIQPHVRAHYTAHHVPILYEPDQYSTDFTKCINFLRTHAHAIMARENPALSDNHDLYIRPHPRTAASHEQSRKLDVVVLGGLGGRVDQGFSQIHHLYMAHRSSSPAEDFFGELYLLSEESLSFILAPGKNTIHMPLTRRLDLETTQAETTTTTKEYVFDENVGIIPLAGPTIISLTGFEWDVTRWKTEIGGQLSTSNHIRAPRLEVEADMPVLFTVELAAGFKKGSK